MKKSLAVMLALIMVLCMIPTTAFAEAGDWDPLTDPNTVAGSLVGNETFSASTTMEAGKDGYLRLMPTLDTVNYTYNAMAYCGATATSKNTSIVEVKSIEIGKWVGGEWDNADCLQVTVNPKAAGTTTVVINFYYTFSQSANPLTNPNAKWFYGTSNYTINVTEPTKPNPPTPENTSKPVVGLTGEEAVKVHCTNSTANHTDESYGLKPNSYTVSEVEGNATNGYTCTITVKPGEYVSAYNGTYSKHTLVGPQNHTINLKWNETDKKWVVDSALPVVFNVKCDNTQPPTDKPEKPEPENTSKPVVGLTGVDVVNVKCTTNTDHAKQAYQLIADSYKVGDVQGDKENGYICEITVKPEKYVEAYNTEYPEHTLDPESQPGKIKLEWDGSKWKVDSGVPVVFDVKCETQEPPTDTPKLPAADVIPKIVGKDAVKVLCTTNAKHAAMRCDLLENSFDIGVVTKEETSGEYFCNITVHADKYVKKYNEYLKGHTLETEGQTGTIKLEWDKEKKEWKLANPSGVPVVFNVKCETQPQPDTFPGVITVKKTVDSNVPADKDKEFKFKVTVLIPIDRNPDPSGPPIAKSANAVKAPAVRSANKTAIKDDFEDENGIPTLYFNLKDGDMMTISDLPVGLTYRVEELDADGYTVTVNNETTSSKDVGLTKEKPEMTLNFKNTKGSTPTPTPYNGGGGHSHYYPTTTPVPVMVIPPKTGDMTLLQYIARLLGLVR